jgi:diketogulonate reductase-like aldo/keto reductase
MSKAQYVFPITGGRMVEHLMDNIKALSIKLSDEQIKELESAVEFNYGFPTTFVGTDPHFSEGAVGFLSIELMSLDWQKDGAPIGHA